MRLYILFLAMTLGLWATPLVALADDAVANGLLVEAVKLFKQAEALASPEEQHDLYAKAKANLRKILDEHPTSGLAAKIALGEKLGPIDLSDLDKRITTTSPDTLAAERALDKEVRAALSDPQRVFTGEFNQQALVFDPTKFTFTLRFTSFDQRTGAVRAIVTGDKDRTRVELIGKLQNARRLHLETPRRDRAWDLNLTAEGDFTGTTGDGVTSGRLTIHFREVVQAAKLNVEMGRCAQSITARCLLDLAMATARSNNTPYSQSSGLWEIATS
jgi:hypothetical protein